MCFVSCSWHAGETATEISATYMCTKHNMQTSARVCVVVSSSSSGRKKESNPQMQTATNCVFQIHTDWLAGMSEHVYVGGCNYISSSFQHTHTNTPPTPFAVLMVARFQTNELSCLTCSELDSIYAEHMWCTIFASSHWRMPEHCRRKLAATLVYSDIMT